MPGDHDNIGNTQRWQEGAVVSSGFEPADEPTHCSICGAAIAELSGSTPDADFCTACRLALQVTADRPTATEAATDPIPESDSSRTAPEVNENFECAVCWQQFGASEVYFAAGRVICHGCFASAANLAIAQTASQDDAFRAATSRPVALQDPASTDTERPTTPAEAAAQMNPSTATRTPSRQQIRTLVRVTCPHCWHRFAPEDILWVSEHVDLQGDQVLGPEAQVRFLPTRFTLEGHALDARGMTCRRMACPHCHLTIPRPLVEIEPLFISIVGVPSSGKSYLLAAMTWELRRVLPTHFAVSFNDADTLANRSLNEYEETLFLNDDRNSVVALRKTELQGELYDQIRLGQQIVSLPRPFVFSVRPRSGHPRAEVSQNVSRAICLYDNAGEHFQPGMDTSSSPVTQHLARSRVMMFLYDPTQDPRFRERCRSISQDPQFATTSRTQRQETILTEAALRVRTFTGLRDDQKHDRPLIIVVSKSDAWGALINDDLVTEPISQPSPGDVAGVDTARVEAVSAKVRALLLELAPEFVGAAEDFSRYVVYIPVSALGRGPEVDPASKVLGIRPRDIRPRWVTVPLLYTFAKWSSGLIGRLVPAPV